MKELPKRRNNRPVVQKSNYSYTEIVENGIQLEQIEAIVIGINDLDKDMSLLIDLLNKSVMFDLHFKDFDSVLFVDRILKQGITNQAYLVDDGERKDRSYIDLSKIKNLNVSIPLTYLMWGVGFNESIKTHCFTFGSQNLPNYGSNNGNNKLSYDDYIKVKQKIEELARLASGSSPEKVALVSDYIQSCTQFIAGYESESAFGTYITPDFPPYNKCMEKSSLIETVLNENYGVCMGIANLSTVLLNNGDIDVEVESVFGDYHVWNKVLIDGKYYYFDNTWSITRSEDRNKDGLITLSFSRKYLLFGQTTAIKIGHHNPQSTFVYQGVISEDDFERLNYHSQFEYQKEPIYRSFKK